MRLAKLPDSEQVTIDGITMGDLRALNGAFDRREAALTALNNFVGPLQDWGATGEIRATPYDWKRDSLVGKMTAGFFGDIYGSTIGKLTRDDNLSVNPFTGDILSGRQEFDARLGGILLLAPGPKGMGGIAEGSGLRLSSTIGGDAMEPALFARIKAAFERNGGRILQGEDVDAYLKWRGVEAVTDNAKQILLSSNPSKSAVFEELIHTAQHRSGLVNDLIERYGNIEAERLLEIQAAEKLIQNRNAYGISNDATRATIDRLRALRAAGG